MSAVYEFSFQFLNVMAFWSLVLIHRIINPCALRRNRRIVSDVPLFAMHFNRHCFELHEIRLESVYNV